MTFWQAPEGFYVLPTLQIIEALTSLQSSFLLDLPQILAMILALRY